MALGLFFFFFKQKTAYEIKECDWSSDMCSSDLVISHIHVGSNNIFPKVSAMPIANGAKILGTLMVILRLGKVQDAIAGHVLRKESRILHMSVKQSFFGGEKTNDLYGVALLPEQMA